MSPSVSGGAEACLLAALRGSDPAWAALIASLEEPVLRVARRWARGLPADLQEEAAHEAWMATARATPADFVTSGQSALAFVASRVPNAVQRVRAAYRAPGTRSRRRRTAPRSAAEQVPRPGWAPRAIPSDLALAESVAEPGGEARAARGDARLDVARALRVAPPAVRTAGELVLAHDLSLAEAAAAVGLSASTFKRRLAALPASLRRAA